MRHEPRVNHIARRLSHKVVLSKLLILVEPRLHARVLGIVVVLMVVVGELQRRRPVVFEPQIRASLSSGHSVLGLLYASQMQSWKERDYMLIEFYPSSSVNTLMSINCLLI